MAEVYIFWDELEDQKVPNRCMKCGKKKAEWRPTVIFMESWPVKKTKQIEVLLCRADQGMTLAGISAMSWDDNGVWLMNVHPDFIEALEEMRDEKPKKKKKSQADDEEEDPKSRKRRRDDDDDDDDRPRRRPVPPKPKYPWHLVALAAVVVFFFMCIPCMIGVSMVFFKR
ncbi:MAG TPA: hypothetical protein VFE62_08805 [Gemmataceae bacterium]|nr:hypothetical protein [Gemmataceae bacterium]